MSQHYVGREPLLARLFGASDATVVDGRLVVGGRSYPIVDDVIICLPEDRLPAATAARVREAVGGAASSPAFAPDVQATFGAEWQAFRDVLPEHASEFEDYFDLVGPETIRNAVVADLGCGSGRWAHFVAPWCDELVAVDFSEAVFVARENLADRPNTVFVMADVLDLPFADDAFDLAYCLGVLHHLPEDALRTTRALARLAPTLLVYLYYALDNRPALYRVLLRVVTMVRVQLAGITSPRARSALTTALAASLYMPMIALARVLRPVGLDRFVPLADTYAGKSFGRIRQDAYDRFFTRIEQRVTRAEIAGLEDSFASVTISEGLPYWHFLCQRGEGSSTPGAI